MKHIKLILIVLGISFLATILTIAGIIHGNAYAYFSSTGNLYSLGLYGGGLGMYGMYGGLGGLYGLYGLGGLYGGGLYGGLYGLYGGMYGGMMGGGLLSNLYLLSLLNQQGTGTTTTFDPTSLLGLYGLYGLGGLYGGMFGGLYGLYGMGGMGGLSSLFLLNQLLGGQNLLTTPSIPASPLVTQTQPTATVAALTPLIPIFIGEQAAGTWVGTWISGKTGSLAFTGVSSGEITLNILEDLDTGALTGQAVFALHPILGAGVELTGFVSNNFISLEGFVGAWFTPLLLDVTITGNLLSPYEMTGTYQVVFNNTIYDIGTFSATLLPPITI